MSGTGQSFSSRSGEILLLGTPKSKHDRSPITTPERPRKKVKLEPKSAPSNEIAEQRELLCGYKLEQISKLKNDYRERVLELCFLQDMGSIMDFPLWKKRPPAHAYQALRANRLDSDDECEELTESNLNEVKVLTTSRSSTPIGTPVVISATLSPLVTVVSQGDDADNKAVAGPSHAASSTVTPSGSRTSLTSIASASLLVTPSRQGASVSTCATPSSSFHKQATGSASATSATLPASVSNTSIASASSSKMLGTQEAIVERAKQEAQVMQRVSELRKQGMWSVRRLPKVQEPARSKAHWDYLLEEMQWLATDFAQERKWKKAGARKIANMIAKYHKEQQLKEQRAEKEESQKTRRIANAMGKMIREFWGNIDKVVEYKQQSRLEEKRKKALDLHLSFIVDQTEKYSSWLTEGLTTKSNSSAASSPARQDPDNDFLPSGSASDDEETIAVEEQQGQDESSKEEELEALKREMELPIEELLRSLPKEVLDKPADINAPVSDESSSSDAESATPSLPRKTLKRKVDDAEFDADQESSSDDEETLEQEEKAVDDDAQANNSDELLELEAEGELPLEELVKKYAGAYESDFEDNLPADDESADESSSSSMATSSDSDDESEQPSDEEKSGEENPENDWLKELDTAAVSTSKQPASQQPSNEEQGPGKELNDIAATARSIQPTGYTLETTKVSVTCTGD